MLFLGLTFQHRLSVVPAARDHVPLIPPFLSLNPYVRTRHGPSKSRRISNYGTGHLHRIMRDGRAINLEIPRYPPKYPSYPLALLPPFLFSSLCGEFILLVES
jgi:hypothetical protein